MSEKKENDYSKLLKHLDIHPSEFLMIGNSLKSDILPVLNLGGVGIHLPYHVTWAHETIDVKIDHPNFKKAEKWNQVIDLIPKG
jgi:putative hydrolase of the HAD superfamily